MIFKGCYIEILIFINIIELKNTSLQWQKNIKVLTNTCWSVEVMVITTHIRNSIPSNNHWYKIISKRKVWKEKGILDNIYYLPRKAFFSVTHALLIELVKQLCVNIQGNAPQLKL